MSVTLLDADGSAVATANPPDALGAAITHANAPAGTYYLRVEGFGNGDLATGYADYASPGEYSISGITPAGSVAAPVALASASPVSGAAPPPVSFSGAGSYDPDGSALAFDRDFGDGSSRSNSPNPSRTCGTPGTHTATLRVTDATDAAQVTVSVQPDRGGPVCLDS